MFLSVIIPVYNVENYLRCCIESVIGQGLKNVEIILVDDGSPDSCPTICDEYSEKYSFIKVLHKKNGGLHQLGMTGLKLRQENILCFLIAMIGGIRK